MANWYCTREQVKRAGNEYGALADLDIDRVIEAKSREADHLIGTFFIPRTETRTYRWPPRGVYRTATLELGQYINSVSTLQTKAQDSSPTTVAAADYFLEPSNPRADGQTVYTRIEIDESSTAAFEAGATRQRSISVAGSWGYGNDTKSAGTVASGLASSASATSMVCSDESLIGVGDTLLIESEQIFVSGKTNAANGSEQLTGNPTADPADDTIGVTTGSNWKAGEVILVDSERMYIRSISSNNLLVIRAYDGTTIAAHTSTTAVHHFRTLTIERGINGTTAATHANSTAISVYEPPVDVRSLVIAEVIATLKQEAAAYGREIGAGEGQREFTGRNLHQLRKQVMSQYRRVRVGAV